MIHFYIVLIGLTMVFVSVSGRLETYVNYLMIQGFLLFLIVMTLPGHSSLFNTAFLAVETLGFKMLIIPLFLRRLIRRHMILKEVEPTIPHFFSVVLSTTILLGGFALSFISRDISAAIKPLFFGISLSVIVSSLLLIITRKKIITHVMAFMMLENGIFLFSLSIAQEAPLIVDLGLLLDLFMAVFLLGIFASKMYSSFDKTAVDELTKLKD